ncbi:MAG: family 78 glycoside hydrolase catalytic domain [Candidatus Omnitrophica bacterium]|nr:family 78 glycoside hydrolase catalytic domain [Candidatus Omnitrophota bacterium]
MPSIHYRFLSAILVISCIGAASHAASMTVSDLRCEYLKNPVGINETAPRLSWKMESDQRGQKQTAYHVLVAGDIDLLNDNQGDLWDSGKVDSNQSIHLVYNGAPMQSRMECYWKVRVWDKEGQPSDWSESAYWSMGLLNPSDWKAEWIGLDQENSEENLEQPNDIQQAHWIWLSAGNPAESAPVGNAYFRRVVHLDSVEKLRSAQGMFTADNSFTLWMNGREMGKGGNFKQLNQFDLKDVLKSGDNLVCVEAKNAGASANPAGLIGCIRLEFKDGKSQIISTDSNWKASDTENSQWLQADFDDSQWEKANAFGEYGINPWGEIQGPNVEALQRRLPARHLRKEFTLPKKVRKAFAYICGLGLFELQINGQKAGDHVLEPGLTEYEDRVFYETFDVTDLLKEGENALGVILGNGRYYAPRIEIPTFTKTYGFPKLLLQMHIEYEDGSSHVVMSGEDWKITTKGPIRANNEYDGEEYDARMEMPGWSEIGFDETDWRSVETVAAPEGVLRAPMTPPIRVTETLRPVGLSNPKPGMYIFDMGQNMVGWCRLKVKGPKGTSVKLRHAELLKEDGTLYLDNIRSAKVTDIYTLKGNGLEIYEPRFTYHGFRYVEMTGFPGEPTLSSLEGRVVHDDVEPAGAFLCSNPLLNQIRQNIYWGVRGNYRSFPTDCPQRDERQAWLGDRAAESKGEAYLFNIAPLYAKWMTDIDDAQKDNGSVPSVAPSYWPMFPDDVTWPSAFTITPSSLYTQYGDVRVLEKHYPGMKQWIDYMSRFLEDDIMPRDTYGDWCVPPESPELIHSQDPNRKTAKAVLGTTYFYKNLRLMSQYASILGKKDDARRFESKAQQIRQAFNEKFFDEEKCQYDNGSQTSYVLPLSFGMVPEPYKQKVFNHLIDKIVNETDEHIGTGLIGGQWLMRVLSDNGRADVAYTIASQKTYPSWGYMIEKGATTVWELWNGDTADPAMNSGNHVMLVGDLNIWMTEYLAGIQADPNEPAFKHIIMRPHPVGDLTSCQAHYDSMHGDIVSDWKIEDGRFVWKIEIPANTTATVFIPAKEDAQPTESGKSITDAPGVAFLKTDNGRAVCRIESGRYQFASQGW